MRVELLKLIQAEIARWPDLGIETVDFYRSQHLREEDEGAFPPTPAVLLQVGPEVRWQTELEGVQQSEPFNFHLHLFQTPVVHGEEALFERYDTMEYLATVLQGYGARGEFEEYFSPFRRVNEVEDDNPRQITHDIITFETAFSDYRPQLARQKRTVKLQGTDLSDRGLS